MSGEETAADPALAADFVRALPCGGIDDTSFEQVEIALDSVEAPCRSPDGRWLTLAERVLALGAELGRVRNPIPQSDVGVCPAVAREAEFTVSSHVEWYLFGRRMEPGTFSVFRIGPTRIEEPPF